MGGQREGDLMARKCTVCGHEQVEAINNAIVNGDSFRNIAKQFNIDYQAVYRHREHIPAGLTIAKEAAEVAQADSLLEQVQFLQNKAISLLGKAENDGDMKTALQGVREARGCLELLAKMQGELQQEGTINISVNPEWLELRAVILQAVEPYPKAREAITGALQGVEGEC